MVLRCVDLWPMEMEASNFHLLHSNGPACVSNLLKVERKLLNGGARHAHNLRAQWTCRVTSTVAYFEALIAKQRPSGFDSIKSGHRWTWISSSSSRSVYRLPSHHAPVAYDNIETMQFWRGQSVRTAVSPSLGDLHPNRSSNWQRGHLHRRFPMPGAAASPLEEYQCTISPY